MTGTNLQSTPHFLFIVSGTWPAAPRTAWSPGFLVSGEAILPATTGQGESPRAVSLVTSFAPKEGQEVPYGDSGTPVPLTVPRLTEQVTYTLSWSEANGPELRTQRRGWKLQARPACDAAPEGLSGFLNTECGSWRGTWAVSPALHQRGQESLPLASDRHQNSPAPTTADGQGGSFCDGSVAVLADVGLRHCGNSGPRGSGIFRVWSDLTRRASPQSEACRPDVQDFLTPRTRPNAGPGGTSSHSHR